MPGEASRKEAIRRGCVGAARTDARVLGACARDRRMYSALAGCARSRECARNAAIEPHSITPHNSI